LIKSLTLYTAFDMRPASILNLYCYFISRLLLLLLPNSTYFLVQNFLSLAHNFSYSFESSLFILLDLSLFFICIVKELSSPFVFDTFIFNSPL
jgi:hypothetical protein